MRKVMLLGLAGLLGCASHPEPIIDTQGVDLVRYEQDLAECRTYAEQIDPASGVAKGTAAGAAVGAMAGAVGGDVARGAGYGAVAGGSKSAVMADRDKQEVVKNCLRGRGYRVLN